jgi:ribulose 1,5-bisphosphate carboxylase large subunit-like protein
MVIIGITQYYWKNVTPQKERIMKNHNTVSTVIIIIHIINYGYEVLRDLNKLKQFLNSKYF